MSWVPNVSKPLGGSIFFFYTLTMEYITKSEELACVRPWTWWVPTVILSTYSPLLIPLVC
jgi:hypothetical protein